MAAEDDGEYEVPLLDQRYFGAGIKRKRIQFVPSTSANQPNSSSLKPHSASAADRYRSIVFKQAVADEQAPQQNINAIPSDIHSADVVQSLSGEASATASGNEEQVTKKATAICDICHREIRPAESCAPHEASIAHQICLQHSYPPSHVDRERRGLAVLQNQGWDPDSRLGLGAEGEGILHPIKAKENKDRAGLGARFDLARAKVKEKPVKLDAGKTRKMEKDAKVKAEKLREAFYRNDDLEKYLGGG